MRKLDIILVFPPMNVQVTHPEIGIPQLTANLRKEGFTVEQHDLNMTFMYSYLARPGVLLDFFRRITGSTRTKIRGRSLRAVLEFMGRAMCETRPRNVRPSIGDSVASYMDRRAACLNILSNVKDQDMCDGLKHGLVDSDGSDVMRLAEAFRHAGIWKALVEMIDGIYLQPRSFSEADILKAAAGGLPLLESFYEEFLDRLAADGLPRTLGLSIGSTSQLLPSLVLARMARAAAKNVQLLAGGTWCTAAKDLLPSLKSFSRFFDAVVIHEGETPLARILSRRESPPSFDGMEGVVVPGGRPSRPASPVPLQRLHMPVYDGMPLDLYPARSAAVRLARGCHWARCDFCHHVFPGYTRKYASAAGDAPDTYLESLVDHMEKLEKEHGIRQFFLSDNGPSVRDMHRLARAILDRGLPATWESLARFEPGYTDAVCRRLAGSGCKALYFGLETCSMSELALLSKGIDLDAVDACLRACSRAGILNFVFVLCHPFRSSDSFAETLAWLRERHDVVEQVIAFRFCLARFSKAYIKRQGMGIRLRPGAEAWLDVFTVPYSSEKEVPLDAFMEMTAGYERRLKRLHRSKRSPRSRRGDGRADQGPAPWAGGYRPILMPIARGTWRVGGSKERKPGRRG